MRCIRAVVVVGALSALCACADDRRVMLQGGGDAAAKAPPPRCERAEECDDLDPCTDDLCVVGNVCEHARISGCTAPRRCARTSDCDDLVACTRDRCLVSAVCDSVADDSLCPPGARCDARQGCVSDAPDAGLDDRPTVDDRPSAPTDLGTMRADVVSMSDVPASDRPAPDVPRDVVARDAVVVDAPAADAGADPRSGTYVLVPALAYACQDEVFKTPVLSLAVAAMELELRSDGVRVTWPGARAPLTGPAVTTGSLRATATWPHPDCSVTLTLTAGFPDPLRLNGQLSLAFSGIGCVLSSCEGRSLGVQGTRQRTP